MGLSRDARTLLELRDRGWFDGGDAIELCGRCWRRADAAITELQKAKMIKRKDGRPRREAAWVFVVDNLPPTR